MSTLQTNLFNVVNQECLANSEALENYLETDILSNLAGIQFPDYMTDENRTLDKNASIGLR